MATSTSTPPISFTRLKQIANDACQSALGGIDCYEHSKTEGWNTTIINSILRSLISESSPAGGTPSYKYAVNSTIIQHLVPTSALNKAKANQESSIPKTEESDAKISTSDSNADATGTDGKPHVGRRGMHSATGAYWNEKTDGMWSFKYEGGEGKGLDVVISVIWISL
ncbi:Dynein light chain [Venustampulla echinocandica]|uniref:Dynein light chain n=1 Tax=Venustampulla echinocandica TaxID=2656787 RepID=A0A370TQV2_9HELO|nr:Dynein light chain [Venustampulla echinocandica]RDL37894.1 Dynein light chain [Venustampulla echinocandica]